jgi:hypothetical protein
VALAFDALESARRAVLDEAERFVDLLAPILTASLHAGFERLTVEQAHHADGLDGPTRGALEAEVDRAIAAGVAGVIERLRAPEIWLAPLTAPDLVAPRERGWPLGVPEWVTRLGRGRPDGPTLGRLDDPGNRIWVALTSAASPLDPVLEEFGFRAERRRLGGGRFGVQPRTLPQLDPSGRLVRPWRRYRAAYERLAAIARARG